MGSYDEVRVRICRDSASLSIFFDLREATFSTFTFVSPFFFLANRWGTFAKDTPIVRSSPSSIAQVSDLKISHGKLVKKMRGSGGVYARSCLYIGGYRKQVHSHGGQ